MGEITDDMINGYCCSLCGQYFLDPDNPNELYEHGYPVACKECWESDCGYEKAEVDTI
jgi:hypothetical protein